MLRALRRSTATAALVLAVIGAGTLVTTAHALGLATLPLALGVLAGAGLVLATFGWRRKRRAARAALRGPRRSPSHGLPGRRYDLARDRTTDAQRWLM